jgi:hypothetical protein
LISGNTSYGNH